MADVFQEPTFAEALAEQFHDRYEALAPHYGYKTREESAVRWEDVPEANRRLMIAVCRQIELALTEHVKREIARARDARIEKLEAEIEDLRARMRASDG